MLIFDLQQIGNKLFELRKKKGLRRAEVAEYADLSDRAYADIERGSVNMRIETMLRICKALEITPNDLFITQTQTPLSDDKLISALSSCTEHQRQTILQILNVYIDSIR